MTDKQIIHLAKTCGFNSGNAGAPFWECWEQQLLKFARAIRQEGYSEGYEEGVESVRSGVLSVLQEK